MTNIFWLFIEKVVSTFNLLGPGHTLQIKINIKNFFMYPAVKLMK